MFYVLLVEILIDIIALENRLALYLNIHIPGCGNSTLRNSGKLLPIYDRQCKDAHIRMHLAVLFAKAWKEPRCL